MRAGSTIQRRGDATSFSGALRIVLAATAGLAALDAPPGLDSALLLVAILLAVDGLARLRGADRYQLGAEAERQVAAVLVRNVPAGYKLAHNVPKRGGGDLDHVLISRRRVIVVETKRSRVDRDAIAQAHRHLGHASRRWRRPVLVVLCVARGHIRPYRSGQIWVLSAEHLGRWLRAVA